MDILIKAVGAVIALKQSIKEQPCVWFLTAAAVALTVKLIYNIGYVMGQVAGL